MKKSVLFAIPHDHPAFPGHFPGTPIVPGVVLLDEALHVITQDTGTTATQWQIGSVKFLSPVKPGETLAVEYEPQQNGTISFAIVEHRIDKNDSGRQIGMGNLTPAKLTPGKP